MPESMSALSERQAKALNLFLSDLSLQSPSDKKSIPVAVRFPATAVAVAPPILPALPGTPIDVSVAVVQHPVSQTSYDETRLPESRVSAKPEADNETNEDDSGSENDGVKRWLVDAPRKPRKVTERKRADAAAFEIWLEENQKELSDDGRPVPDQERSLAWLVKDDGSSNIIDSPYDYQVELFERAKQQNTIAVLDTGMCLPPRTILDTNKAHLRFWENADRCSPNPMDYCKRTRGQGRRQNQEGLVLPR